MLQDVQDPNPSAHHQPLLRHPHHASASASAPARLPVERQTCGSEDTSPGPRAPALSTRQEGSPHSPRSARSPRSPPEQGSSPEQNSPVRTLGQTPGRALLALLRRFGGSTAAGGEFAAAGGEFSAVAGAFRAALCRLEAALAECGEA
eukprot:413733-Prorocentrum_minimum.AAC.1